MAIIATHGAGEGQGTLADHNVFYPTLPKCLSNLL